MKIIAVIFLCFSSCNYDEIAIEKMDKLTYGDSVHSKGRIFIVNNYNETDNNELKIDTFVFKDAFRNIQEISKYDQYDYSFYKKSPRTDFELNKLKVADFGRYSNDKDWIYLYQFYKGRFLVRFKVKDGKFVDPLSNIKVY